MSGVAHSKSKTYTHKPKGCHLEPPEFDCAPTCEPCSPCGDVCKPKTRARDSVAIEYREGQRCVSLRGRGCKPSALPAFMHKIEMKVRRKGSCSVITTEIPYKAKYDGSICFNWSNRFKSLPDGYYEGDVYINCVTCYTWAFHIRGCYVTLETDDTQTLPYQCGDDDCGHKEHTCGGCGCCGTKPPIEPEVDTTIAKGCEEC